MQYYETLFLFSPVQIFLHFRARVRSSIRLVLGSSISDLICGQQFQDIGGGWGLLSSCVCRRWKNVKFLLRVIDNTRKVSRTDERRDGIRRVKIQELSINGRKRMSTISCVIPLYLMMIFFFFCFVSQMIIV